MTSSVTREQALNALRPINDPELGYSVVDLGLVYEVTVSDTGACEVRYTLTSPGCPFGDALERDIRNAVSHLPGISNVTLTLTFDPPWGPEKIADPLRRELRMMGLAV
ncbi:MAG: metal-sulfur cluster assembly factor [bacterium]|nr:metal-sulfur cluster assembly factor [bacterium]